MKRSAFFLLALPIVACTSLSSETSENAAQNETASENTQQAAPDPAADHCLDGQDLDATDSDISACPALPKIPLPVTIGSDQVSLGAWEMGTTSNGDHWKYGSLEAADGGGMVLDYDGGQAAVNDGNLQCWAKNYYRLRKILQDAPREYLALRGAHFQYRFFQFQSDLRNGTTGFKKITSYQDHLVKWVSVIDANGVCQLPTRTNFRDYAKSELQRRGITLLDDGTVILPVVTDAGTDAH